MILNHIILAILWIAYCVLHSVLASVSVKMGLQKRMKSHYPFYRIYYIAFAFISLVALLWFQLSMPTTELFQLTNIILIAGLVISFSGLILMIVCIQKYFLGLSGLRNLFQQNAKNNLIISGVHKYMRHPLYLGTFAFIWGGFLMLPYLSLLITNTIITVYTIIGIKLEEQKLVAEFGDSYREYQQNVSRLLPIRKAKQKFKQNRTGENTISPI